jgi:hypothetical protein
MKKEEKYIGYLKYSGKSVENGILDARKSAEALLGFDEILRFFLLKEHPELVKVDYEIPVKIEQGSWIMYIPTGIIAIYFASIANKAGSGGFFETGPAKDVEKLFKGSIKAAQWMIKIGSHLGTLAKNKIEGARIKQLSGEVVIEIPNESDKLLNVPKKYFDMFTDCPEKLFSKNANIIEEGKVLELGVFENGVEEKVSITEKEKSIFYKKGEEDDTLFPELKHGQNIQLEGGITRGNEKTNTLGFEYKGHVLTCRPANGHIVTFKNKVISQLDDHFFPIVKIIGVIDRTDENHLFK